jgi:hypothetical protein
MTQVRLLGHIDGIPIVGLWSLPFIFTGINSSVGTTYGLLATNVKAHPVETSRAN